ncbi:hypothetical protein Tco_0625728 [Tanacetum coccineum]|uniref:Retrotransposon gag domain-containing protein n=1 Tax=Tanacetum coccineum TaxID=301880 RepID=A0ABQ4WHM0_9ASTR
MIFRLYTSSTIEEKLLRLAEHNVTIDRKLQNISRSTSDVLLTWGTTYLFNKLDEFHNASGVNTCSEECLFDELLEEFVNLITHVRMNKDTTKLMITRAQPVCGIYGKNPTAPNKTGGEQPHTLCRKLLVGRNPCWKYLAMSNPRQRKSKRPQYIEKPPKKITRNERIHVSIQKTTNNLHESVASKPVTAKGASKSQSFAGDSFWSDATTTSFHDLLKLKISKLCKLESAMEMFIRYIKNQKKTYVLEDSIRETKATNGLDLAKFLDVGIKVSGKLQFLDLILPELRKQKLRVLILYQDSASIGYILDDFLCQRFGEDSYERIDGVGIVPSKNQAALNNCLMKFKESVRNCFGPSEYEDPNGALSKLLQLGTVKDYQREFEKLMNRATGIPDSLFISFYISGLKLHLQREFLVSRPTTLGDAFSLSLITEARLDDQAAPVAGTMTKTFGNNGGDESESSGPVTPTSDSESSGEVKVLNWVHQSIDVESAYDNDARDQVSESEMKVLADGKQDEVKVVKVVVVAVEQNIDEPDVLEGNGVIGVGVNNEGVQYSVSALHVLILLLKRLNDRYIKKKKMEAAIQRRIWDPGIKIYFRHHLEDKVVVKEWGMIRPRFG